MFYSVGSQKKPETQCTGICHCQRAMTCWSHNWMAMPPHCKRNNHDNQITNNTVSYLCIFPSQCVPLHNKNQKTLYTLYIGIQNGTSVGTSMLVFN